MSVVEYVDVNPLYRFTPHEITSLRAPRRRVQAPYVNVTVFARGLLKQAQTRMNS